MIGFFIAEFQSIDLAQWFGAFGALVLFLIIRRAFSISLKRRL